MHARSGRSPLERWRRLPALAGLAAAIPLAAVLAAPPASSPAGAPAHTAKAADRTAGPGGGLIVSTTDGKLRGGHAEGVDQFLGVRYAAPPVGALRWQAPQPVYPWTGIRGATSYGHRCAQLPSGNGPREDTEDCLFLNVFAPADRPGPAVAQHRDGHGLPVLFMIHGGGLANGAGDQHDGSLIVKTDHIIVVSVNYRLDVFGFLDVPGLAYSPQFVSGGPELPLPPVIAVADGDYARVPLLMGTNHDEGRTFTQGFAYTEQQYVQVVEQSYGTGAPAILQRYPWAAYPAPYTAFYAIGAIWTDSGFVAGIGGCPPRTWPPSSPAGRPRSSTSSTTGTRPR